MLEILISVLALVFLVLAAKKGRGKRRFNLRKVRVSASDALGALASLDVTTGDLTATPTERILITSAVLTWTWEDIKAVADGTFEVGIAHGDYTAAEIEECFEANSSIDAGDKLQQEKARRMVRTIGVFPNGDSVDGSVVLNDGRPIRTKLNWVFQTGKTPQLWARNGSQTVYTTGSFVSVIGNLWVKDL